MCEHLRKPLIRNFEVGHQHMETDLRGDASTINSICMSFGSVSDPCTRLLEPSSFRRLKFPSAIFLSLSEIFHSLTVLSKTHGTSMKSLFAEMELHSAPLVERMKLAAFFFFSHFIWFIFSSISRDFR